MTKRELFAALAELPDDCHVYLECTTQFPFDFRVSMFEEDGPDAPPFACLTLIFDGVDDDDIHIVDQDGKQL
jgi:hypothetical protein